jgi:hypothetical protein
MLTVSQTTSMCKSSFFSIIKLPFRHGDSENKIYNTSWFPKKNSQNNIITNNQQEPMSCLSDLLIITRKRKVELRFLPTFSFLFFLIFEIQT